MSYEDPNLTEQAHRADNSTADARAATVAGAVKVT
jgi:hypothetical protein